MDNIACSWDTSRAQEQYEKHLSIWTDLRKHLPELYGRARGNVLEVNPSNVSTAAFTAGIEKNGGRCFNADGEVPKELNVLFLSLACSGEKVKDSLERWGEMASSCILVHGTDVDPEKWRILSIWAELRNLKGKFLPESSGLGIVEKVVPLRVAAIIPARDVSELVDAMVERIQKTVVSLDIIVVDDDSQPGKKSKYTALSLHKNLRPNRTRRMGLHYADYLGHEYFGYWMMATSALLPDEPEDLLLPLVSFLSETPDAVCVQPAYSADSRAPWAKLLGDRGTGKPRQVWTIEFVAALYRADWFNAVGRLGPEWILGWGTDLELSYKARMQGRSLWVHEGLTLKKDSYIAHEMDGQRRERTADEYWTDARGEMKRVLEMKYGPDWKKVMESQAKPEWA